MIKIGQKSKGIAFANFKIMRRVKTNQTIKGLFLSLRIQIIYPLDFIPQAKIQLLESSKEYVTPYMPCLPVSLLTSEQAMDHFISGQASKLQVLKWVSNYHKAFLSQHRTVYSTMLATKMKNMESIVDQLILDGQVGKIGKQTSLKIQELLLILFHSGEFENFEELSLKVPRKVTGVPSQFLHPKILRCILPSLFFLQKQYDSRLEISVAKRTFKHIKARLHLKSLMLSQKCEQKLERLL
ncbi:unnamed protein product [Paramecium octaurelia]|uniref:Uncharacterized protein n=1 Tax=Paramecium octaurelia TaxID=43137 RepID=A0A8S1U0Q5_PAROT|nr:unnamed protein product [Paramecium octaurelia]